MEQYTNNAITTLAAPYIAGDPSIEVADETRFPPDGASYSILLGNPEKTVLKVVTNNGGTSWSVEVESDDADAAMGATVTHVLSARTFDAIKKDMSTRSIFAAFGNFGGPFPYKEGTLHFFTDTPFFGRDDGTGPAANSVRLYHGLTRAGRIQPNTWFNQGTAAVGTSGAIAEIRTVGDSPPQGIRGRSGAVPLSAWERRLGLLAAPPGSGTTRTGLFARESGTGKVITLSLRSSSVDGLCVAEVAYWDDHDTLNTVSIAHPKVTAFPQPMWYKMQRAGSNLIHAFSKDGYFYEIIENVALTTFFTTEPDQAGFFVENETEIDDFDVSFISWEEGVTL